MTKLKKTLLLIWIIITSPIAVLSGLLLLNTVNPMQLSFVTSFNVENQSGQDIWITPIGTIGEKNRKARLPIFITAVPAIPAVKTARFLLKDGDTLKIRYDWDDINFSEIAIESKEGQFYQFVVNPNPTENQYHPLDSGHFIIPSLETLLAARPNVREAATRDDRGRILALLTFGGIALLVTYWRIIELYKKEKTDKLLASAGIEG